MIDQSIMENDKSFFGIKKDMNLSMNASFAKNNSGENDLKEIYGEITKILADDKINESNHSNKQDNSANIVMSLLSESIWKESATKDDSSNFNLKFEQLKNQISAKKMKKCLNILKNCENPGKKNLKENETNLTTCEEINSANSNLTNAKIMHINPNFKEMNKFNNLNKSNMKVQNQVQNEVFNPDYTPDVDELPDIMVKKINSLNMNNNNLTKIKQNNYLSTSSHSENLPHCYLVQNNYIKDDDECDNTDEFIQTSKINRLNTYNPKFFNEKINLSTRFSTNESNESFDSIHKENLKYFTPVQNMSEKKFMNISTQKLNFMDKNNQFVNYPSTLNYQPRFENYSGSKGDSYCNTNEEVQNPYQIYNLRHLAITPKQLENAFSINTDNNKKKKNKEDSNENHFNLNFEKIISGKDKRTTLMIRNIPNKYTVNLLLEEINTYVEEKFDFLYLPIDSSNNCNLGFAFVNFINPFHILLFYDLFKGKKWKRFNSDKKCELTYAKFQGKKELNNHFNGSNTVDDKKPVIIQTPIPPPRIEVPICLLDSFKRSYPNLEYDIVLNNRFMLKSLYGN